MYRAGRCSWPVLLGVEQPPFPKQAAGVGKTLFEDIRSAFADRGREDGKGLDCGRMKLIEASVVTGGIGAVVTLEDLATIGCRRCPEVPGALFNTPEMGVVKADGDASQRRDSSLEPLAVSDEAPFF
jgi:hypothetical protein